APLHVSPLGEWAADLMIAGSPGRKPKNRAEKLWSRREVTPAPGPRQRHHRHPLRSVRPQVPSPQSLGPLTKELDCKLTPPGRTRGEWPSGLKATPKAIAPWPFSLRSSFPVAPSRTRTKPRSLAFTPWRQREARSVMGRLDRIEAALATLVERQ